MRKVLIAMGLAGALALGSVSALATSDSGLIKDGKAALQSLKLARATCFDKLEGTFDSLAVPEAKVAQAEAALQTAQDAIDHGSVNAISAFTGLKAALEAVQGEDEDEDSTTADKAAALQAAIDKAKTATAAIPGACTAADTALHNALAALGGVPEPKDEDEAEADDDSQTNTAAMHTVKVKVEHEKHEKKDHDKKQEREHEDSERD